MTPERLHEIQELFHSAREATAEVRAALLAEADPELRREVESLLAQPGGEFLDRPAIQNAPRLLEESTRRGVDAERTGRGREPGAIPHRKQARRGRDGRSLSSDRHAPRLELVLAKRTPIESSPLQQVALAVVMGDKGHALAHRHRCGSTDYVHCVSWHELFTDSIPSRGVGSQSVRLLAAQSSGACSNRRGSAQDTLRNQCIQGPVAQLVR